MLSREEQTVFDQFVETFQKSNLSTETSNLKQEICPYITVLKYAGRRKKNTNITSAKFKIP